MAAEKCGGVLLGVVVLGAECVLQIGFPSVDKARWGLSVIPSLRGAAWSATTGTVGRGQSEGTTSPGMGVMTCTTRVRPRYWWDRSCAGLV